MQREKDRDMEREREEAEEGKQRRRTVGQMSTAKTLVAARLNRAQCIAKGFNCLSREMCVFVCGYPPPPPSAGAPLCGTVCKTKDQEQNGPKVILRTWQKVRARFSFRFQKLSETKRNERRLRVHVNACVCRPVHVSACLCACVCFCVVISKQLCIRAYIEICGA